MGRLDASVSDSIEEQFRMEAIKRFGARKGNLSRALEEAMDLWIKKDVLENLRQKASDPHITMQERNNIVDTIKTFGAVATVALSEILKQTTLESAEVEHITKTIKELKG